VDVRVAVKIVDVLRDHCALGVLPRALADAVAGVGGLPAGRGVGAEIGVPSLAARPGRLGQRGAMGVRARKTAEIAALAGADAGDEERHIVLLGLQDAGAGERQQRRRGEDRDFQLGGHGFSLLKSVSISSAVQPRFSWLPRPYLTR